MRDAIKELSAAGVGAITYPSGRVDTLETAVRRAIVTGVNKTAGEVQWQLADEMGCDLVQVTAHGGARPEHAAWQGGIYSRSGKSRNQGNYRVWHRRGALRLELSAQLWPVHRGRA